MVGHGKESGPPRLMPFVLIRLGLGRGLGFPSSLLMPNGIIISIPCVIQPWGCNNPAKMQPQAVSLHGPRLQVKWEGLVKMLSILQYRCIMYMALLCVWDRFNRYIYIYCCQVLGFANPASARPQTLIFSLFILNSNQCKKQITSLRDS